MRISKLSNPITVILLVSKASAAPAMVNDIRVFNSTQLPNPDMFALAEDYTYYDAQTAIGNLVFTVGCGIATIGTPISCPATPACTPVAITAGTVAISGFILAVGGILGNAHLASIERGAGGLDERLYAKIGSGNQVKASSAASEIASSKYDLDGLDGNHNGYRLREIPLADTIGSYQSPYYGSKIKRLWVMDNYVFRRREVKKNSLNQLNASSIVDGEDTVSTAEGFSWDELTKGIGKEYEDIKSDYSKDGPRKAANNFIGRMIERYPQTAYGIFYESEQGIHVSVSLKNEITVDKLVDLILSAEPNKPFGMNDKDEFDPKFFTFTFNIKGEGSFYQKLSDYLKGTPASNATSEEVAAAGVINDYWSKYMPKYVNPALESEGFNQSSYCGGVRLSGEAGPSGQYFLNTYGPVSYDCSNF